MERRRNGETDERVKEGKREGGERKKERERKGKRDEGRGRERQPDR